MNQFRHTAVWLLLSALLSSLQAASPPLFDIAAIRDPSSLEITVIDDWKPSAKDASIRQKLIEVTVCEWWPGQKVRLPVTLNVPAEGGPCQNVVVANQGLANKLALPTGGQLTLLKEHGVGVVLIGMGTIDAMKPVGQLHEGMRQQILKTQNARYTPAWIWGMSQMRALTAALTEPEAFAPEKVLTTGGSKRGVASAVAAIHDDRFTAILPVVAPPLGNPGTPAYVIGTAPENLAETDDRFFADLTAGKLGLDPSIQQPLEARALRRASTRVTMEEAKVAGWSDHDIATITDRVWDACRTAPILAQLQERGLEVFYNVGTNDSVTPLLLELGRQYPAFPICIIPGGQHGGPSTAGFTRRTPLAPEVQDNFLGFALHHFANHRSFITGPEIQHQWNPDTKTLTVIALFANKAAPQSNALWWNLNRSEPYTLPYEYDQWDSTPMKNIGTGKFEATIQLEEASTRIDFLTLHTDTENNLPLTVSSPYLRIENR
tara:strand:+ start:4566 stop:6035 length:1470 start_codon:yes stop_codon:yes gene_type:complete